MKVKNKSLEEVKIALLSLEGNEDVVRAPGQPDRTIRRAFELKGNVRWNSVKNLRLVSAALGDLEAARVALVRQYAKSGEDSVSPENMPKFAAEWVELLNAEVEIPGLLGFSRADLNCDVNSIPQSVLLALTPLMLDDAAAA